MSTIGFRGTPGSMAAFATAGGNRGKKPGGEGTRGVYFGPYFGRAPYRAATSSGTSSRARLASACAAAIFISILMVEARTSSAPRKMNGKPRILLTWLG